jgi:two-component sensor histidine kinase
LDVYYNIYGIGLIVIAVILAYKYGFLQKHLKIKLAVILAATLALIEFSARRSMPSSWITGLDAVLYIILFLTIMYFAFEKEIERFRRRHESLEKEYTETQNKNTVLEKVVADHTVELQHKNEALEQALQENKVLLQEVHHRVKNNLATMVGLFDMQLANLSDETAKRALTQAKDRIMAMASVHEQMYLTKSYTALDMAEHVSSLTRSLSETYGDGKHISIDVDIKGVYLDLDESIYCGLMISEAVTNSMKHAFPGGGEGNIRISAEKDDEGTVTVTVCDNGVGFQKPVTIRSNNGNLGLWLIENLATMQLDGSVELLPEEGTCWRIRFNSSTRLKQSVHPA